jgi:hypothetical protein
MKALWSTLKRMGQPEAWLTEQLARFEISAPDVDLKGMANELPWQRYQQLSRLIVPGYQRHPGTIFRRFGPFVTIDPQRQARTIDIRDVYGISASKSHIVPLQRLSRTWSVVDILSKHEVDALIPAVLHGSTDCVAQAGQPVSIMEQAWDGRLYVRNSGGSHRFGTIWRWYRENERPLLMDCSVETARIASETLEAVEEYRYWLRSIGSDLFEFVGVLSSAGDRSLFPDRHQLNGSIAIRPLGAGSGLSSAYCVAYRRSHPLASVMDERLEASSALDLAAAVQMIAADRET